MREGRRREKMDHVQTRRCRFCKESVSTTTPRRSDLFSFDCNSNMSHSLAYPLTWPSRSGMHVVPMYASIERKAPSRATKDPSALLLLSAPMKGNDVTPKDCPPWPPKPCTPPPAEDCSNDGAPPPFISLCRPDPMPRMSLPSSSWISS